MSAAVWGALAPAAVSCGVDETDRDQAGGGGNLWGAPVLVSRTCASGVCPVKVTRWRADSKDCGDVLP